MDLHRSEKQPEWSGVSPARRNIWQRTAERTRGIVTPGNSISIAGAGFVAAGLVYVYRGEFDTGLVLLVAGRLADVADGLAAARTGTKSSLGEAVDATVDKVAILAALIIFALIGVVPLLAVGLIALLNATSSALGIAAKARKRVLHPSWPGKVSTALQWSAFLLYAASELLSSKGLVAGAESVFFFGGVAVVFALLVGIAAIRGYAAAVMQSDTSKKGRA